MKTDTSSGEPTENFVTSSGLSLSSTDPLTSFSSLLWFYGQGLIKLSRYFSEIFIVVVIVVKSSKSGFSEKSTELINGKLVELV